MYSKRTLHFCLPFLALIDTILTFSFDYLLSQGYLDSNSQSETPGQLQETERLCNDSLSEHDSIFKARFTKPLSNEIVVAALGKGMVTIERAELNHNLYPHNDNQLDTAVPDYLKEVNHRSDLAGPLQCASKTSLGNESRERKVRSLPNGVILNRHQPKTTHSVNEGDTLGREILSLREVPIHYSEGNHLNLMEDPDIVSIASKEWNLQNSTPRRSTVLSADSFLSRSNEKQSKSELKDWTKETKNKGLTSTSRRAMKTIPYRSVRTRKTSFPAVSHSTTSTNDAILSENDENSSALNRTTGLIRPRASRNGTTRKAATPTFTRKNSTPLHPIIPSTVASLALSRRASEIEVLPRRKIGSITLKTGMMTPRALPSGNLTTGRIGHFLDDVKDVKVMVLVSLTSSIREVC